MIGPFVDAGWLAEHAGEVVVADVRFYLDGRTPRAAYEECHLPGAVFVPMEGVLAGPVGDGHAGRHPLPSPEAFASGLGILGIGDGTTTVAYDDAGGVIAARLAWMLRALGHHAALLDGGLKAWPGPTERGPGTQPAPAVLSSRPWPAQRIASIEEVAAGSVPLIDARDRERFGGGPDPVDPRSGHIPGSRSLPARENLRDDGRLLDGEALRGRSIAVGIETGADFISYCGSGVSACFNLLALEHAGLGSGRLYPGSWSQWSRDAARPVET